jgi:hypothetical protein
VISYWVGFMARQLPRHPCDPSSHDPYEGVRFG